MANKLTVTLDEVSQSIDLSQYLGREPTESEKENFAIEAIDRIENRTLDGLDKNGRKFTKYSKEYAKKKGVSISAVDLFDEGKLLDSLNRFSDRESGSSVVIGIDDDLETKIAYNHQVGDTLPKRSFFGLSDSEAEAIALIIQEEDLVSNKEAELLAKALAVKATPKATSNLLKALSLLDLEQIE